MIRNNLDVEIEKNREAFEAMAASIWEFAETGFQEYRSSALQQKYLKSQGFRIVTPLAGMDTAFCGEYGEGRPVIALLGEFDALPGLSQQADVCEHSPVAEGMPGHGCGHNLLGTAGVEAACAVKTYMQEKGLSGTVRYYGCPAEENGSGKVYMILDGAFKDVDCSIAWHPGVSTGINKKALAISHVKFRFEGKAAHAYAAPFIGRSALDAAELMNVGIQFLREHVKPNTYMHYAFTNSGGTAPNIVQPVAELSYILRCDNSEYLLEVYDRVCDVARGAALMTGTKCCEPEISASSSTLIFNRTLADITEKNIKEYFPPEYTEEELAYAEKFIACGSRPNTEFPMDQELIDGSMFTCTDAADVSWVTPSVLFKWSTLPIGTPGHSWNTTAQGKSAVAYKGMHSAAKVMANTVLDLIENPNLVDKAKAEFEESMRGREYRTNMEGLRPPVSDSKNY